MIGNNFPLAHIVFLQNALHHKALTCMRDKKGSSCVEKLWMSILFKTKQWCAASSPRYRSEEWVLRTISPRTDFYISFLTSLLHAWRLHVLPIRWPEAEPNSLSSSRMPHCSLLLRWAWGTFAPSWFWRGSGSLAGTRQNSWNTFGLHQTSPFPPLAHISPGPVRWSCRISSEPSSLVWGLCSWLGLQEPRTWSWEFKKLYLFINAFNKYWKSKRSWADPHAKVLLFAESTEGCSQGDREASPPAHCFCGLWPNPTKNNLWFISAA